MTVSDEKNAAPGWYEYFSSYWGPQSPKIPDRETLDFCTISQLRQYSESLTAAVTISNERINTIEVNLSSVNDKAQKIFTEALANDAIAYDKLQDLTTKVYDIKHSVFTTLPDSKKYATDSFPSTALGLSKKVSWDHYDTLSEQIDSSCNQQASEEAIEAIDKHLSKLTFLTHKLATRKLAMIRELSHQSEAKEDSFQTQKEQLEASFAKREKQFQKIHSTLLHTKEKFSELCIERKQPPEPEVKIDETQTVYSSYIAPVIDRMRTKVYETGFEQQPTNIFHQLISEYYQAKETAQQSMDQYNRQCAEAFKVYQEHELAKNERTGYIETKQYIENLIKQKDQFVLVGDTSSYISDEFQD